MKKGLLVMTYGSPADYTFEGIGEFYTNIRNGIRPDDNEIEELFDKYKIIGSSPLQSITKETVERLKGILEKEFKIYYAYKFSDPKIQDTILKMETDGIEKCLCLVLEPHYSMYSLMGYESFIHSDKIKFNIIPSWHNEEFLIRYWAEEITDRIKVIGSDDYEVIFTAHSVPDIAKEYDDSYIDQIRETTEEIIKKIPIENLKYIQVWQSESQNGMDWIKPDVLEYIRNKKEPRKNYIFAPIGFISDHIETYYDIDFECKTLCDELGADFHRIQMPNNDDRLIEALVSVVRKNLDKEYKLYTREEEHKDSQSSDDLKMPFFVKKLIEKKGKENVKMPEYVRKMLIKAGKIKE